MLKRSSDTQLRPYQPPYGSTILENEVAASAEPPFDLRKIYSFVRRRLAVIAGLSVLGSLLAVIYALQLTPLYTATATVLVDPRKTSIVDNEAVLSGIGREWSAVESEVELIRSASVAIRVIDKLGLSDSVEQAAPDPPLYRQIIDAIISRDSAPEPEPISEEERRTRIARNLASGLHVSRLSDTYLLTLAYTSPDPALSARIVNSFADAYLVDQLEAKFEATRRANTWLNERIAELRDRVREAERAAELYRAENNLIEAGGVTLNDSQVRSLNEQLILARAATAEARAKLEQLQEISARGGEVTSFAQGLQTQVISQLRSKQSEVKRELAELSAKYGSRHPSVISVRSQLGDVQSQIRQEVQRIEASTENEYRVAKSREDSIEASLTSLRGESVQNSQSAIRLRELEREAAATRTLFESFLARFKETTQQESLQTADSRIVERATRPTTPGEPNKKVIAIIGFILSLGAGIGAAYLLETLDNGFRTAEQVEAALNVPVLATIPQLRPEGVMERIGSLTDRLTSLIRSTPAAGGQGGASSLRKSGSRQVLDHPLSAFTESIRSLRMGLRYADLDNPARVVMFTSALPSEGKSTVASNLALHAANTGENVLLIDMDLRHPALTEIYAGDSERGVVELVMGEARISDVVRTETETKLRFIPASRSDLINHTSEILGSDKIRDFLAQARNVFDLIVIDSSPLLPVTDARALLGAVDAAVMVVCWERTSRDAVRACMRQTFGLEDKLVGAVLSQVDSEKGRYYDYYKSGYYAREYPYYYADRQA
jgi:exopolysaccharide transport family protein